MSEPVLPARARRRRRRRHHRLLGRLPPGPHGLEGRRAARARPAHLRHHVARRRAHRDLRLDVRDVDRDAQVHARPLRAARGRDRASRPASSRSASSRSRPSRDRLEEYRRVSAFNRLLRRRRARDLGRRRSRSCSRSRAPTTSSPASTSKEDGRAEPGRRHDGARQGRAHAGRDDPRGRARSPASSPSAARSPACDARTATSRASTSSTAPACGRASSARRPA